MSLDPSKFKDSPENKKEQEKLVIVVFICVMLTGVTWGLSWLYMFYYIFKKANVMSKNYTNSSNSNEEQSENLYEELEDTNTQNYYKYDNNDISQEEIHEHREDFWNVNSPIKYK